MGAAKWKYVKREMEKRGAEQATADVYIDGTLCPHKTVQMEIRRQAFETQIGKNCRCKIFTFSRCWLRNQINSVAPSPEAPGGVIICSPGPSSIYFLWPPNLPWFNFSNTALMRLEHITGKSQAKHLLRFELSLTCYR